MAIDPVRLKSVFDSALFCMLTHRIANMLNNIQSAHDTEQITVFTDDVSNSNYVRPGMTTYSEWMKFSDDVKVHSISSILSRPVKVGSGFIDSVSNVLPGDIVTTLKFPDVLLANSSNIVDKLNYFLFFRANVHIKVLFNATPFMAGKYWCTFVPFASETNRVIQTNVLNQTGYPGCELDLASGAPVCLKIPYCSTLSHYNLVTAESSMGDFFITTLNAITSGSSVSIVSYTIFAWFEDIELHVPTSKPVLSISPFKAQMKTEEALKSTTPPISALMNSIGNVARSVSGISPRLAAISKPVEWISRFMAGGFATCGFNKPNSLAQNTTIDNMPGKYYTHADGVDRSVKLAAMPDNAIPNHAGLFSSSLDEMDINHVVSKSAILVPDVTWSNSYLPGTIMTAFCVSPGLGKLDIANPQTYFTTPLSFVSSIFQMWNGGIKYRISFAKTGFHSGRIRVSFHPGIYNQANTGDSSFVYNEILDLSVSSEIEFTVPYVSNVPWKYCEIFDHGDTLLSKYATGIVLVEVLTSLMISSDSVANFVKFNVWVSGDSDMSFAIPNLANHVIGPFSNAVQLPSVMLDNMKNTIKLSGNDLFGDEDDLVKLVDGSVILKEDFSRYFDDQENVEEDMCTRFVFDDGVYKAQIFNETGTANEHNEQVVDSARNFFNMKTHSVTMAEELTIGEKVNNLRQVIKRFSPTFKVLHNKRFSSNLNRCAVPFARITTTDGNLNTLRIDPSYFGDNQGAVSNTFQNYSLYVDFDPALATGTLDSAQVASYIPLNNLTNYISHIYRFYTGSRRYKLFFGEANKINYNNNVVSPVTNHIYERDKQPYVVARSQQPVLNGAILKPQLINSQVNAIEVPTFSSVVYPDLNGCMEFEVPYYAQTPISIVGQGTITSNEGPLLERNYIFIQQGLGSDNSDYTIMSSNGTVLFTNFGGSAIRYPFNGCLLMEAAGDDFNFGYQIGSPSVKRIAIPT